MEIEFNNIKRILIIQYQPFGDVLLNTGYLPSLRKKFSDAKIDFLVRKPYHVVLEDNPHINEIIIFDNPKGIQYFVERLKLYFRIRNKKYDLVIDQIRGPGSAQITLFSGAKYRLGYDNKPWKFIYNILACKGNNRYYSSLKFDLLKPLGIEEEPHQLYFHIKPESMRYIDQWFQENNLVDKKLICFSPGSPVPMKKWKLKNYAKLADLILENTDRKVVLLWGPSEKDDVKTIAAIMKNKPIIALPSNFNQAAAMLKRCELLVCNDGGINHLAIAVQCPSLALFGPTNPLKWVDTTSGFHHFLYVEKTNFHKDNSFGISAEMAFNKVIEILKI